MNLLIPRRTDVAVSFGDLGSKVGPRKGLNKRTHDEKEWFCLRQYVEKLAVDGLLDFPLMISKGERPDFILKYGDTTVGVEVTEATTEEFQRELTLSESNSGNGGKGELEFGDGWVGKSPEHEVCQEILTAIEKKSKAIRAPDYRRADLYEILIYLNSRAFFADSGDMLDEWRSYSQLILTTWPKDGLSISASLVRGTSIIYDLLGNLKVLFPKNLKHGD